MDFELVRTPDDDNPTRGDLRLVSGRLQVLRSSDPEAVTQRLLVALRWFLGEHFADQRLGVPWFQAIFRPGTSDATIRSILRRTIAHDPAIIAVDSVDLERDRDARSLSVSFAARTQDGGRVEVRDHDLFSDLLPRGAS